MRPKTIVLFANTAWYLFNFRLDLAIQLKQKGFRVVLLAPNDKYIERLRNEGFDVQIVELNRRGTNPFSEFFSILAIAKILKGINPDVVFNFTIKCVIYGSIAARFVGVSSRINAIAGLGIIYTGRGYKYKILRMFVTGLLKLAMRGQGSRLIVQNTDDADLLLDNRISSKDKLSLIKGSGVNGAKFCYKPSAREYGCHKVKVLFAARLLWAKGVGDLIEATNQLSENVQILIAGQPDPGNPDSVTMEDMQAWGHYKNISLVGHVEDMPALLDEVDLVVLPSRYGEGVPRILVEAAATGLPLVAYDVAGSREIVVNEVNGFLISQKNSLVLAEAINRLASDAGLRRRMGAESRRVFDTEYEQERVNRETLAVVYSTLGITTGEEKSQCL